MNWPSMPLHKWLSWRVPSHCPDFCPDFPSLPWFPCRPRSTPGLLIFYSNYLFSLSWTEPPTHCQCAFWTGTLTPNSPRFPQSTDSSWGHLSLWLTRPWGIEDHAGWPVQTCGSVMDRSTAKRLMSSWDICLWGLWFTEQYFILHLVLEYKRYFVSFNNTKPVARFNLFYSCLIPLDHCAALGTVP